MNILHIVLLIFFSLCLSCKPVFEWANSAGISDDDKGLSIATDASGNVYTVGFFTGTVDFDPGPGTYTLNSNGKRDIFVQKLDPDGNLLWAFPVGGNRDDMALSVCIDNNGDVCLTGTFELSVDFDPDSGTSTLSSDGSSDIFIAKYDDTGAFIWAKRIGNQTPDNSYCITNDAANDLLLIGLFSGTVDFDPGPGSQTLSTSYITDSDIFILKLDPTGNFIWAKSMGSNFSEYGYTITTDASNNIYTSGKYFGTVDFDPGGGVSNFTSNGSFDIFIQKLDPSGNFLWAKSIGSNKPDQGNSIAIDLLGNIYLLGEFQETVDFDPGPGVVNAMANGLGDVFVLKLDPVGDFEWVKTFGGSWHEEGRHLAIEALGYIYVIGKFVQTVDFDPGPAVENRSSNGGTDIFVMKLDGIGDYRWAKSIGSSGEDYGEGIALHGNHVHMTGSFENVVDFDPGSSVYNLSSNGISDIFVAKWKQKQK